jgi:hypothetical protein
MLQHQQRKYPGSSTCDVVSEEMETDSEKEEEEKFYLHNYSYQNNIFTKNNIRARALRHSQQSGLNDNFKASFHKQLLPILYEEYEYIKDKIRPLKRGPRNYYRPQKERKGMKREMNGYTLFCQKVKLKYAEHIRKGKVRNEWTKLNEVEKGKWRLLAKKKEEEQKVKEIVSNT